MSPLPPGPGALPLHTLYRWLRNPYPLLDELRRRYGETFTLRIALLPPMVMLSNPEHIKEVFASNGDDMHAGKLAGSLRPFLGARSLLLLDGPEHRWMRKLVLPPFHGERMQAYGAQMMAITQQAIDDICSILKIDRKSVAIPEGGSTQRVFKNSPDRFKKSKPAPMRIVVWQYASDPTHGHFGMCLSYADGNGLFQTFEFNTNPDPGAVIRDGQGAHFVNRNVAGTRTMRILGYIDLFDAITETSQ